MRRFFLKKFEVVIKFEIIYLNSSSSSSFTFNVHFSMLARVGRFPPYRPFHRILSCVHSALSPPGHRSSRLTHSPHVGALRCKRGPRPGDVQASPTQLFPIPDWEFLEQIFTPDALPAQLCRESHDQRPQLPPRSVGLADIKAETLTSEVTHQDPVYLNKQIILAWQ